MKELQPCIANAGDKVEFKCQLGGDDLHVTWYLGNEDLTENTGVQIVQRSNGTNTLTLESAKIEDEGEYTIQVKNETGSIKMTAELKVIGE